MEMALKKRFGISVPRELADQLDQLASKLGVDRSSLVVEALKTYIHDHLHLLRPHNCIGVMISKGKHSNVAGLVEEFRDIIISYNHYHVGEQCIITMIISGDSSRIQMLSSKLLAKKCSVRYIPLKSTINS